MKIVHWADLEDEIEKKLKSLMVYFPIMYQRLYDTKSAGSYLPAQPCDFLVWAPKTPGIFLEAKYSGIAESLRSVFSNAVSDQQLASARLASRAGQKYWLLFYGARSAVFELWDGKYCSDRRAMGKPLEITQRVVCPTLGEALETHVLGLDQEKLRRLAAKEKR